MFTLDLYKLEIFARVAEAGSLSQAANQLRMTQSGVSQYVKALEDGLGTPLFERGRRGVRLTAAGRRLYDYSEAIFRLVAEAELAVTDVTGLRQGQLTVQTVTMAAILSELRAGQIELAVIEGEVVRAEHELELLRALPLTGRPLQRTLFARLLS